MDEIDRILSSDDDLVPSSGFSARVMEAVEDSVAEDPPLTFPWGRFAIGVIACLVWAAATLRVMTFESPLTLAPNAQLQSDLPYFAWAATATALITLGAWRLYQTRGSR